MTTSAPSFFVAVDPSVNPHASDSINGIPFAEDRGQRVAGPLTEEQAAPFRAIPGFIVTGAAPKNDDPEEKEKSKTTPPPRNRAGKDETPTG